MECCPSAKVFLLLLGSRVPLAEHEQVLQASHGLVEILAVPDSRKMREQTNWASGAPCGWFRAAYQVPKGAGGVLVRTVHPIGPAAGKLEQGDVLLRLDDVPVASDATVPFRTRERICPAACVLPRMSCVHV